MLLLRFIVQGLSPNTNFTHSAMKAQSVYIQLKDRVDGNNRVEIFCLVRPNQEQLRKMQLYIIGQEPSLRPCNSGAVYFWISGPDVNRI